MSSRLNPLAGNGVKRLSDETRNLAEFYLTGGCLKRNLNGEFSLAALHLPESTPPALQHARLARQIAERSRLEILPEERLAGAAPNWEAMMHQIPGSGGLSSISHVTIDFGNAVRLGLSGLEEEIRERLDVIRRLSRKYAGASTGDMVEKLQEMEAELSGFETLDDRLLQTEKEEKQAAEKYAAAAALLTRSRKKLAQAFEKEMETQLKDLNMGGTRFRVNLDSSNATASGVETARFLIAPNRGEEMQPLSRIASGGELSRLMLAIKSVAAKREGIPSMIFDEIDTGISGKAAQVVGEKMKHISRGRQVLCVTHLQQIAALADCHFLVEKAFDGQRTSTRLTILDGERRVSEIARMLGGDEESAKQHAREMLKQ